MPTSPVTFQEKPDDDVCVHLISGSATPGTQTSTTPEEISSIPSGDLSVASKLPLFSLDCKNYQLVFIAPKRKPVRLKCPNWTWFITHLPLFTMCISLIQIIFYFELTSELRQELNFDPKEQSQLYRFFTYMLLHVGALHLVFNVVLQHILGTPLELEQGHLRTAFLYIGGGIGGALGAAVVEPTTAVEGASAGVYAILIAQIPHMVLNYQNLRFKISRIVVVVILLFADVGHTTYHISTNGNANPTISVPAHAFGAVTGLLLGFVLFQGISKWTIVLQILSATILLILGAGAKIYIVNSQA